MFLNILLLELVSNVYIMIIVLLLELHLLNFFQTRQILDPIREDGPTDHIIKKLEHLQWEVY